MHDDNSPSWKRGLRKWLHTAPETRDELLKLVQESRQFLEDDTVAMLEGVLDLPATKIREVMTPRTALVSLREDDELLDILQALIESAHSRFPVFSAEQNDTVVGVLLAKDLLPFLTHLNTPQLNSQKVDIATLMRQPLFVPESARSDQVLRMLRTTQTHLAIVVDEHGTTSGIVTLEDILEEIVGEIEDEHDDGDQQASWIKPLDGSDNTWIVQALTPIEFFNEQFNSHFSDDEVETMAGLILQELGLVSDLVGQSVELDGWRFQIIEADARSIQLIEAKKL
ncbi:MULTISPECIES: HlyC/CorC family transporter [unclassified Acinetobacter]|uniref:HlyC/CorC family transporter n=1 Tax=unclassified Acinetobacter TaxID=196816 RepID=UPI0035BB8AB4